MKSKEVKSSLRGLLVCLSFLLLAKLLCSSALAMPVLLYVRTGDPLRIVWEVADNGSMGIIAESPSRARCFVIGKAYRELTLMHRRDGQPLYDCPKSLEELAERMDMRVDELPHDVIQIWRGGYIDWPVFLPGYFRPIADESPDGPYLAKERRFRQFPLGKERGFLLVAYYDRTLTRLLRLPPPGKEFVIRPKVGLPQMVEHYRLSDSDICRHLGEIHRGHKVNWSDLTGYFH